ncbi:MAG: 3-isopropylmalate dehydratase small subunit, partial [Dehalococcoidales bacterium]|nr:3-isopropylmalate dehydratase small subunit [Dehalococcoidales bacterium]
MKGKVHKYGANVDTDAIIPARYLNVSEPKELAVHCMEDIDTKFVNKVEHGDIIMATTNFGCGSSREHAPLAIKASGISCVIAESFARIFFRNAINIGLPLLECSEAVSQTNADDILEIDLAKGKIKNLTS